MGVPSVRLDEAVEIIRSRYVPIGKFENTPYSGIRETLEALRAQGRKLYVATSKPEVTAREILEHFDLSRYFAEICGATVDKTRTSKEDVIAYLLSLDACRENSVMVGDTAFDVIGAAAHGIPTIGAAWGYGKTEDMVSAGAISYDRLARRYCFACSIFISRTADTSPARSFSASFRNMSSQTWHFFPSAALEALYR